MILALVAAGALATAVPIAATEPITEPIAAAATLALAGRHHELAQATTTACTADADGRLWAWRGLALAETGDAAGAADAFAWAECRGMDGFLDKTMRYRRAWALAEVHAYGAAARELDRLARQWPYSRLAARDETLRQRIDARLAEGVGTRTLAWYAAACTAAASRDNHGLAVEYGAEYLALAGRNAGPDHENVRLTLATSALAAGDARRADDALAPLADPAQDYRVGLIRALVRHARGDATGAKKLALETSVAATDPTVRARAESLWLTWSAATP